MTTPPAAWPRDFAGAHSTAAADHTLPCPACAVSTRADDLQPSCDICSGHGRISIGKPVVCWLDEDHDLPHPLVVEALDEVLLHGQMTAARGILGMTEYRLGTLCGIRSIAIATGMWSGAEMALVEECEAIIGAWHDVAKDIAARRDQFRAELIAQAEEAAA